MLSASSDEGVSNSLSPSGYRRPYHHRAYPQLQQKKDSFISTEDTIAPLQAETLPIWPFTFVACLSLLRVRAGWLWMPPWRLTAAHPRALWLSSPVTGAHERDLSSSGVRSGFVAVSRADTLAILSWSLVDCWQEQSRGEEHGAAVLAQTEGRLSCSLGSDSGKLWMFRKQHEYQGSM